MAELAMFLSQKGELMYTGNLSKEFVAYKLKFNDDNYLEIKYECSIGQEISDRKEHCLEKLKQAYFESIREADRDGGVDHREGKLRVYRVSDNKFMGWVGSGEKIGTGMRVELPNSEQLLLTNKSVAHFDEDENGWVYWTLEDKAEPETPSPEGAFATTFDTEKFSKEVEEAAQALGSAAKGQIQPAIDAIRNAFERTPNAECKTVDGVTEIRREFSKELSEIEKSFDAEPKPDHYRWRDPEVEMPPRSEVPVDVEYDDDKFHVHWESWSIYRDDDPCYRPHQLKRWRYSDGDPK